MQSVKHLKISVTRILQALAVRKCTFSCSQDYCSGLGIPRVPGEWA